MKRNYVLLLLLMYACGVFSMVNDNIGKIFKNAEWIAMEQDSTILFPHIHLLRADSEEGQSLKTYTLPVLTKSFKTNRGKVKRALVNVCGMGQYELFVNGEKAGSHFLSPGWTLYNRKMLYNELDVTEMIRRTAGRKVELKVMLGGGMYDIPIEGYHKMSGSCGAPKLLLCLDIEYENGKRQTIVSDRSWYAEAGPVRYSSIYAGEWYDATFTGKRQPVEITAPRWDVPLEKQQEGTFVKIDRKLDAVRLASGIYDMKQNFSGIVRLRVRGDRGKSITLRPTEILKNGRIYQNCMPGYEWKYTLGGNNEEEIWQPQFTYTGFRYVEVVADEGVELLELSGLHTTTDTPEVGSFECSDTLFNKIHSLIDWAIRSNMVSITTDCPTREKLGWQEQNHLMAYSMMYRYDVCALMNKIADDLAESQHPDGAVPTTAPEYTFFEKGSGFEDTPEWGASFILCPWYTYLWYGDDSAMRKHYEGMKRYVAYLMSRSVDGILDYGLGDWFDMGPRRPGKAQLTSVALTATAMLYYDLTVMEKTARHLGFVEDAAGFAAYADNVKKAFNQRFATGDGRVYENGSQAGLAMAIYMGLTTDSTHQQAVDALVSDIERRGYVQTAGDVGFRYVIQALQQNGRSDVICRMNRNDAVPGYAYQLKKGATALTESWQAYDNVSNNHMMLGHLMEWFYGGVGGISTDSAWKHITIRPQMPGDMAWAKASVNTPRGKVECHWERDTKKGVWTVEVNIPEGSDARVCLPDGRDIGVKGGRHSFASSNR